MSEINHRQSTPPYLTVLVLLLVAAVGVQTWYMLKMKKKLDAIQSDPSSSQSVSQDTAEAEAALAQGELVIQETAPDEINIATENPAQPAPPASAPPTQADDGFLNTPQYSQTWKPHEEMQRMQQYMDRTYYDRYNSPGYNRPDFSYRFRQDLSQPEMDVREDHNQYIVFVNLPDADEKDIAVKLEGQRLTVMGKQEHKKQDRDTSGHIIFSERRSGRFKRGITLYAPVDKKGMQTRIDNGVLRIIIPKKK